MTDSSEVVFRCIAHLTVLVLEQNKKIALLENLISDMNLVSVNVDTGNFDTGDFMPLTKKGKKIMKNMKKEYGEEKAEKVFYASKNAKKIKGVEKKTKKK